MYWTDVHVCYMYCSIGVCFDVRNNMIWMCSNDWVDQFFNPGHQSPHHIHRRLKVTDEVILPPGQFKLFYSVCNIGTCNVAGTLYMYNNSVCQILQQICCDDYKIKYESFFGGGGGMRISWLKFSQIYNTFKLK